MFIFGDIMKRLLLIILAVMLGSPAYAQSTLYVSGSNGNVGIGTTTPNTGAALDMSANTNAVLLPVGTTAQRPSTGVNGMLRYNSTIPAVEAYVNGAWVPITTGGGGFTSCTQVVGANSSGTSTATCSAGFVMTGGGCQAGCTGALVAADSYPSASNSWACHQNAGSGCTNTAYAICCQ
jgi:hypothetical protein